MKLLIASTNRHKVKEIGQLLAELPIALVSLSEFPHVTEVEEDGETFRENAIKKATSYAQQTGYFTLAEDSGLTVDALSGAPGIYSARYAGVHKSDLENCDKLLKALKEIPHDKRSAQFRCAAVLSDSSGVVLEVVEDKVDGLIYHQMSGLGGFGYDPLFFYPQFGKTFGEITSELKHSVSHRGKVLRKLKEILKKRMVEFSKSGG